MKILLLKLHSSLLKFHQELLFFQTQLVEKNDSIKLTPYDLLNLSLNDFRFMWLKKYSDLIIQIDIFMDDKKNSEQDYAALISKVRELIAVDREENNELRIALRSDSSLMMSLGQVKLAADQIKKSLVEKLS